MTCRLWCTLKTESPCCTKVCLPRNHIELSDFKHYPYEFYSGDLTNEDEVLKWLTHQAESDEIEDVTDEMLDKLIAEKKHLAVLFCELVSSTTSSKQK